MEGEETAVEEVVEAEGTETTEEVVETEVVDGEKEVEPKKTPISDEHRALFPDKFKFYEDVAAWGTEAEKAKSRAETEKDRIEREHQSISTKLDEAENAGSISTEEKQRLQSQFTEDWNADAVGTLERVLDARDKRNNQARDQVDQEKLWKDEFTHFKGEYGDKWDEVKAAIVKIATENPHFKTVEEAVAVFEYREMKGRDRDRKESELKKTSKKEAFTETSGGGRKSAEGSLLDKIGNADSFEELEKLRPHAAK